MDNKQILIFGFDKKSFYQIIFIYFTAHIGIFFSINSFFWDDYTLVGTPDSEILQIFKEAGSFLNITGWLHLYLLKIGPWVYKLLTFILFLFSGLFFSNILKRHEDRFNEEFRFYCVLFFLTTPIYLVRPALIVLPYGICFFLFFLAWSLIKNYRFFSIILFFFSFIIPSFLVFFIFPFLELFY